MGLVGLQLRWNLIIVVTNLRELLNVDNRVKCLANGAYNYENFFVQFNEKALELGPKLRQPRIEDLRGCSMFKYAPLDYIHGLTPYVKKVIGHAPIVGNHKYVLVDVKISKVQKGRWSCLRGWHCDVTMNPVRPERPEKHHLFVSGHNCLTEFVKHPSLIQFDDKIRYPNKSWIDDQLEGCSVIEVPSCQYVTYGRRTLHRGPKAKEDEIRLLVRITETDIILPIKKTIGKFYD